jgi:hypothetical protein
MAILIGIGASYGRTDLRLVFAAQRVSYLKGELVALVVEPVAEVGRWHTGHSQVDDHAEQVEPEWPSLGRCSRDDESAKCIQHPVPSAVGGCARSLPP